VSRHEYDQSTLECLQPGRCLAQQRGFCGFRGGAAGDLKRNASRRQRTVGAGFAGERAERAQSGAQEREPAAGRPDKDDLQRQLDEVMKDVQTSLRFRVDDDSNRVVVSIVDQTSGDVIQQIPSEVSLRIAKRMAELGSGIINESA
jgi:flagellar protein FlaG